MSKGTDRRTVRVDNELWAAIQAASAANGSDVSTVTRELWREYVAAQATDSGSNQDRAAEEFARARRRSNELPVWARPAITQQTIKEQES